MTQGINYTITTYTYNGANELTAVNGRTFSYDANGNMTSDGDKTYVYNEINQLVEVRNASGTIVTYEYDFEGKRISKTTNSGAIKYYYSGQKVVYETDAVGNVIAEYTWDQNGRPVTMTRNGSTYYYQLNGHGDVIKVTDENGNIVAQYEYDAWGNILSQSGSMAEANPFRYAGYMYDEETGLYYLMARYYDAELGRFISRDIVAFLSEPISLNLYAYTYNNPIVLVDEEGMSPERIARQVLQDYVGGQVSAVRWKARGYYEVTIRKGTRVVQYALDTSGTVSSLLGMATVAAFILAAQPAFIGRLTNIARGLGAISVGKSTRDAYETGNHESLGSAGAGIGSFLSSFSSKLIPMSVAFDFAGLLITKYYQRYRNTNGRR